MRSVRELLLEVDIELEDYSFAISRARNPALSPQERLKLIRASQATWARLEAARRELAKVAG
ncbi:hypothetical protein [Ancylobacter amanitiformis]|uniref:Uncharacterized protein n=1 Tax=Ancylobacter amanitiformis TaxID=217069 RepID=A0ABU0LQY2_9HYPH|nr:hypothetical protein [Ancylobacter amanitiformis]MDQ0511122.1 hypothetical protein [Ancylobacter amanitiformis]